MTTNNVFAWSGTAGSNTDVAGNGIAGSNNISLGNDVFQNIMAQITNGMITRGSDIATASTVDFTAATTPSLLHDLTGTTTVTAVTMTAGWWRLCRAQGAFQLTASSTLVVNGSTSTNYTTTAGDLLIFFGYSASTVRVWSISGASLPRTGGTLTGDLTVSKGNPTVTLNKGVSGQDNSIFGQTNGLKRWLIDPGNATAEGGANAGSDFSVYNYDDTGAFVGETLKITRSTGRTTLQGLTTTNATGGDKGADTINATTYYKGGNYGVVTLGTPAASTSGTSIDFTGIPAGVRRVTINFVGVSLSGSAVVLVQVGAGSVSATGYIAAGGAVAASPGATAYTAGFGLSNNASASDVMHGTVTLSLENIANGTWSCMGALARAAGIVLVAAGSKTLSGTLDRVRITSTNGTDTFDAGEINISYE